MSVTERVLARAARARRHAHFESVAKRGERRDILFVSGPGGGARRYRCDHAAEQLALMGKTADVGYRTELRLDLLAPYYDAIVLFRVPWDDGVESLLQVAPRHGTRVLADVDDLVFDPSRAELLHELAGAGEAVRAGARETMARLRDTLAASERVTVSTEPLRRAADTIAPETVVVPNVVSAAMIAAADRARASCRHTPGRHILAYLSGTATHDRDFLEAGHAVLSLLERYPQAEFWAAGFITLDERFERFAGRVRRLPFRPWRRLPGLLAQIDVNLAPLEPNNDFTDAKSCLKYLEAAVVGVPTVASPTADFRRAIVSGENGLLAGSDSEWREALEELVESDARRRSIGAAARDDVLANHTTRARAAAATIAYRDRAADTLTRHG